MFKSGLNVFKWIAILPLVGLKDGKIDQTDAKAIGDKLIAIVAAVTD